MINNFEKKVEKLLDLDGEARAAHQLGKSHEAQDKLAEGLAISCVLLEDMLNDYDLDAPALNDVPSRIFRQLTAQGDLDHFLSAERRLLLQGAKLAGEKVERLVTAMREVIDMLMNREERLGLGWRPHLEMLAAEICATAKAAPRKWTPLLKRGVAAAGGGLIVVVNYLAPQLYPPSAIYTEHSVAAGRAMIEAAMAGWLDNWADS